MNSLRTESANLGQIGNRRIRRLYNVWMGCVQHFGVTNETFMSFSCSAGNAGFTAEEIASFIIVLKASGTGAEFYFPWRYGFWTYDRRMYIAKHVLLCVGLVAALVAFVIWVT